MLVIESLTIYLLYDSDYHNEFPKYKMMRHLELQQKIQHLMGSRMAENLQYHDSYFENEVAHINSVQGYDIA